MGNVWGEKNDGREFVRYSDLANDNIGINGKNQ